MIKNKYLEIDFNVKTINQSRQTDGQTKDRRRDRKTDSSYTCFFYKQTDKLTDNRVQRHADGQTKLD